MKASILCIGFLLLTGCNKETFIKKDNLTKQDSSFKKNVTLTSKDLSLDHITADLNGDGVDDYVFRNIEGMSVFDGKSSESIPIVSILSKPGMELPAKVITVNCKDGQKALLVESSGGGTMGNYHYMDILRYDQKTGSIQSVFRHTISAFSWVKGEEKLEEVNYIDALYGNDKHCSDTINVYEGEFIGKKEAYKTKIKPKRLIEQYTFNSMTGQFEKYK